MNCDLCNKEISATEMVRIPVKEMQQAVRASHNPLKTPGIDTTVPGTLGSLLGLNAQEIFEGWRQRAMSETMDWGLCPTCAKAFRQASK